MCRADYTACLECILGKYCDSASENRSRQLELSSNPGRYSSLNFFYALSGVTAKHLRLFFCLSRARPAFDDSSAPGAVPGPQRLRWRVRPPLECPPLLCVWDMGPRVLRVGFEAGENVRSRSLGAGHVRQLVTDRVLN